MCSSACASFYHEVAAAADDDDDETVAKLHLLKCSVPKLSLGDESSKHDNYS